MTENEFYFESEMPLERSESRFPAFPDDLGHTIHEPQNQAGIVQPYSSLHTHSDHSHDGIRPLPELVKTAATRGFKHLAITEHGTLSSSVSFVKQCQLQGIKPILGNEVYLELNGNIYHLTLLADGNKGFSSLVKLNNIGKTGNLKRNAFPFHMLEKHNEGIIVLSGCPVSPMQLLEWPEAKDIAIRLKNTFGDRFFAEIMFTTDSSLPVWERSLKLAQEIGISLVFTNDVHFPDKKDAPIHTLYQEMKSFGRFTYNSKNLFLATGDEIRKRVEGIDKSLLPALETGMANSFLIGEKLNAVHFDETPKLPHIDRAEEKLEKMVWQSFSNLSDQSDEIKARVQHELDIINKKGYATYFLIVSDLIQEAKASNVVVGPGRGSAVGSMVAFLLGITKINPIDYDLNFERFLNPNREAMPDIDTDIAASQRSIVLEYAKRKYGAFPIATQSHNTEKSLIRDLCRHFRTSRKEENEAAEGGFDSPAFNNVARKNHPLFRQAYETMLGQIRHLGKHAGGIVIAENIEIPYEKAGDELVAAWTEGSKLELSQAGIIKFDFLGLSALDILKDLQENTGVFPPEPTPNAKEFELVREGKTLGIFQLTGSDGIRDYAMKVAPTCIDDIIAITSLWRSGPIRANAHEKYLNARHGSTRKIHPKVDKILEKTYGLIVFQEDFMRLYAWATGRDLGDADNARRAVVKYKPEDIESVLALQALEVEFKQGATMQGLTNNMADQLWNEIVAHTGYSFNKSHATAYSMISWWMIWYKYHYPAHYYTALLNHDPERQQEYIFDVVAEGFKIEQPDVNKSSHRYSTDGKVIYVPFTAIKFLGDTGAEEIIRRRPFSSAENFMNCVEKRKLPLRSRVGLYQLGAFRSIGGKPEDYDIKKIDMLCVKNPTQLKKTLKELNVSIDVFVDFLIGDITDGDFDLLYQDVKGKGKANFRKLLNALSVQLGEEDGFLYNKYLFSFNSSKLKVILQDMIGIANVGKDQKQAKYLGIVIPNKSRVERINQVLQSGEGKSAGIVLDIERRSSQYNPVYYRVQLYPGRSIWTTDIDGISEGKWIECDFSEQTGKLKRWREI